jgi:hypothetical protein
MPSDLHKHRHRGVLDDLLGEPQAAPPGHRDLEVADPPAAAARPAPTAQRLTLNLPVALIERARNAVYHSPGLTLSSLSAEALRGEIDRLERARGNPFPAGRGRLRVGRPIR